MEPASPPVGCFVTLRAVPGVGCVWASLHYARLCAAAHVLGCHTLPSVGQLIAETDSLLLRFRALGNKAFRARWSLRQHPATHEWAHAVELAPHLSSSSPVSLAFGAGIQHLPTHCAIGKWLDRSHLNALLGVSNTLGHFDALLQHPATGHPVETTRANWLVLRADGKWCTPGPSGGAYPGVGIAAVALGLKRMGLELCEEDCPLDATAGAWVVNALRGMLEVCRVGGHPLPTASGEATHLVGIINRYVLTGEWPA